MEKDQINQNRKLLNHKMETITSSNIFTDYISLRYYFHKFCNDNNLEDERGVILMVMFLLIKRFPKCFPQVEFSLQRFLYRTILCTLSFDLSFAFICYQIFVLFDQFE